MRVSPLPCVAIGGITVESAGQAYATGVAGVCAISGLLRASNVEARARSFRRAAGR
ncbi:MAG: thiamine phosphate synthase [Lentisphaeria bacterium]|nr:thiamine phosphate synthase [Lentisphaeria bacterium]